MTSAGQGYVSLAESAGTVVPFGVGQSSRGWRFMAEFRLPMTSMLRPYVCGSLFGSRLHRCVVFAHECRGSGVCYLADWVWFILLTNGAGSYATLTSSCPVLRQRGTHDPTFCCWNHVHLHRRDDWRFQVRN